MPYVQRNQSGVITGLFANQQDFASEYVAADSAEMAAYNAAVTATFVRQQRDTLLSGTDWLALRHRDQKDAGEATTLTDAQFASLLVYRQALRDWPASASFPNTFPTPPELS